MRYAVPTLALLLLLTPATQATEEFRFTGEIAEWASLFGFRQTPEQAENNPPLPYLGVLELGELNDDWSFRFEIGTPPVVFEDGVTPSELSENPVQSLNTVFNEEDSLLVSLFHVTDFSELGEGNLFSFNLDKLTGTGQWSWSRYRSCSVCEFTDLDPEARATITAFATVPTDQPGDFNGDGAVSAADYTVARDSLGALYRSDDIAQLQNSFGAATTTAASIVAQPVPEPASTLLFLAGLALPAAAWRRL